MENCITWDKGKTPLGYGKFRVGKKFVYAHRYFYEKEKGKIPKGLVLDHLCKNPSCVNVNHLEPVTQAENVRRSSSAKLKVNEVSQIRKLYSTHPKIFNQPRLASIYGVGQDQISRIVNLRRWA